MTNRAAVRTLIWTYFMLLIFEGVLRKWLLPGWHEYFLFVRDPVVILIFAFTILDKRFPWREPLLQAAFVLGIASLIVCPFSKWFDPITAAFGFRVQFFHLPLIWIIPRYFDASDAKRLGRWTLIMAVPITLLMVAQFKAERGSPLNYGVGGQPDAQIMGALGRFRPSGPFPFITGPALFYPLATAFVLAALVQRQKAIRLWLAIIAGGAIMVAVPVSISRGLALSVGIVFGAMLIGIIVKPRLAAGLPRLLLAGLLVASVGASLEIFRSGMDALSSRWAVTTNGQGIQETIVDRVVGGYINPLAWMSDAPLLGLGLGTGTNVGARRISGHVGFMHSEDEWGRIILEMGPILGSLFLFLRVCIAGQLIWASWGALKRQNILPWLITSAVVLNVLNGQWGPPTNHGFAMFGAGLVLAAAVEPAQSRKKKIETSGKAMVKSSGVTPAIQAHAATTANETVVSDGRTLPGAEESPQPATENRK